MNIEQAKALKVGDYIILNKYGWSNLTYLKTYPVIRFDIDTLNVIVKGDDGEERFISLMGCQSEHFDLVESVKTNWIAFDAKLMGESNGYRLAESKDEVTDIYSLSNGDFTLVTNLGITVINKCMSHVEMQVEDKIEWPQMMMVKDIVNQVPVARIITSFNDSACFGFISDLTQWKYATTLTDDELKEIGLQRYVGGE